MERHSRGLQSIIYTLVQSGPELALLGMILGISGLIFSRLIIVIIIMMIRMVMMMVMVIWMVIISCNSLLRSFSFYMQPLLLHRERL